MKKRTKKGMIITGILGGLLGCYFLIKQENPKESGTGLISEESFQNSSQIKAQNPIIKYSKEIIKTELEQNSSQAESENIELEIEEPKTIEEIRFYKKAECAGALLLKIDTAEYNADFLTTESEICESYRKYPQNLDYDALRLAKAKTGSCDEFPLENLLRNQILAERCGYGKDFQRKLDYSINLMNAIENKDCRTVKQIFDENPTNYEFKKEYEENC